MELRVYSIRDSKAEIFNQPFFQKTDAEAQRSFAQLTRDGKSTINQFPEDFDLYFLGTYDDQTGVIKTLDTPKHMLKAIAVAGQMQVLKKIAEVTREGVTLET